MKKLLVFMSAIFSLTLLSGCDMDEKMMKCSIDMTTDSTKETIKYDVKYIDDDVKEIKIIRYYSSDTRVDGTNTGTDGSSIDDDTRDISGNIDTRDMDDNLDSDDIVDGVVGNAIDGVVDGVTDTILDISGIRDNYNNQIQGFGNITGFKYDVEIDNDHEYKVIYTLNVDDMSDSDLSIFNMRRSLSDLKDLLESQDLTCKNS